MTISVLQHTVEPAESMEGFRFELESVSAHTQLRRRRLRDRIRPSIERRRSDRVHPGRRLRSELERLGPSRIICLSLGGATLEGSARLEPGIPDRLTVTYGEKTAAIEVVTYQTSVKELFYAANGLSWICYRSHAVFQEPSIEALNLVYRIIADHWVAPGDDDTRPAPSSS